MMLPYLSFDPFGDVFVVDPNAHHASLRDAGPRVWVDAVGTFGMARFGKVQAAELARQVRALRLTAAPVRRLNSTLHAIASSPVELKPA